MNAFKGKCHLSRSSSSGTPQPIFKKICTVDYVGDLPHNQKFGSVGPKGMRMRMREIVIVRRLFFFFLGFFIRATIDTNIDDLGWTAVRSNFVGISRDFATLGGNHG